jgi:TctA family transporter
VGNQTGTLLILVGLGVAAIGALVYVGAFRWFGHLPGDIRIETENTKVFVPITSMIIVSLALTLIANIARRLL